jgi:dihydroneopterin aldolase/D-erythro-7,8-dihydroneopterin triphosphate epimerase
MPVPDRILITDLLVRGIIGVNDDERTNRQDIVLNLALDVDTRAAGVSDDIADTVNYRTIAKQAIALTEASSFHLVEKLAEEIARLCLAHEGVQRVTVRVDKPGALRFARSVGIEITRDRGGAAS